VIQLEEIVEFIDGHSKPLIGAREINNCGYLLRVGFVKDTVEAIELKGCCIQVSHPGQPPFQPRVIISKPFPGHVLRATCQCDGGSSGKCKHAVAILRSVET